MKEYKPINVLYFILLTLFLLLPVVYFAPKDGYRFFGLRISFLSWENLLNPPVQERKNIDLRVYSKAVVKYPKVKKKSKRIIVKSKV